MPVWALEVTHLSTVNATGSKVHVPGPTHGKCMPTTTTSEPSGYIKACNRLRHTYRYRSTPQHYATIWLKQIIIDFNF